MCVCVCLRVCVCVCVCMRMRARVRACVRVYKYGKREKCVHAFECMRVGIVDSYLAAEIFGELDEARVGPLCRELLEIALRGHGSVEKRVDGLRRVINRVNHKSITREVRHRACAAHIKHYLVWVPAHRQARRTACAAEQSDELKLQRRHILVRRSKTCLFR